MMRVLKAFGLAVATLAGTSAILAALPMLLYHYPWVGFAILGCVLTASVTLVIWALLPEEK